MTKKSKFLFIMLLGVLALYAYSFQRRQPSESTLNRQPSRSLELGKMVIDQKAPSNEVSIIFNDPAINSKKWELEKTGAIEAWKVSQGSRDVVVAIIDTGCDINHEDLKNNIWTNPGETGLDSKGRNKATNGIDDDNNGFVDDVRGWNFVNNNNLLTDTHGHGTHIAGIIGAEGNGKGSIGISPKVSMMILKYYDPKTPTDNLKNTIAAIKYATKMKANIINYSGGGLEYSEDEKAAIKEAQRQGVLFVAAAGNEHSNSDKHKYFPADYGLPNIISVTAIDPKTQVLNSSNYGVETVDLAAPGEEIKSTLPNNAYGTMTGTSQATAWVSGAAAVVMAYKHNYSAEETKKYLISTGDGSETLVNKTGSSRKLNLYKALTMLDSGIGITGIQAANVNGSTPIFSPESTLYKGDGNSNSSGERSPSSGQPGANNADSNISAFGKSLLQAVQKQGATPDKDNAVINEEQKVKKP